ncbi:type III PLP-dependent enzyme [Candidatus Gracilibacteria bacterium]|nr:type III PLP-dependent enzyme [Candidatus Gracilibacteria bacterium]
MSKELSNTSTLDRSNYISDTDWDNLQEFIKDKSAPFLVLSKEKVKNNYNEINSLAHGFKIRYAVKACPNKDILKELVENGSGFEVASVFELDDVLSVGGDINNMIYGNTIKKERDIKYAYDKGIRIFATDCKEDLLKISRAAPGVKVYFRIAVTNDFSSGRPLSLKFGCDLASSFSLVKEAKELGLEPYGISFHVGSYQDDLQAWESALGNAKKLYDKAKEDSIELKMINLGGGMYAKTRHKTEIIRNYLDNIYNYINKFFGEDAKKLEILMEPGSIMAKDIGVLVSEVVLAWETTNNDEVNRIYLDIGKYGGLLETTGETIKYPIYTEVKGEVTPVILAGPTCDSTDVMYKQFNYLMPKDLKAGDLVYFFNAGAYTQSCASVGYNGYPALKTYVI